MHVIPCEANPHIGLYLYNTENCSLPLYIKLDILVAYPYPGEKNGLLCEK